MNAFVKRYLDYNHVSLNAVAQSLKRMGLTRDRMFELLGIPHNVTTHNRYWSGTYNIKPWEERTSGERDAADFVAREIILHNLNR